MFFAGGGREPRKLSCFTTFPPSWECRDIQLVGCCGDRVCGIGTNVVFNFSLFKLASKPSSKIIFSRKTEIFYFGGNLFLVLVNISSTWCVKEFRKNTFRNSHPFSTNFLQWKKQFRLALPIYMALLMQGWYSKRMSISLSCPNSALNLSLLCSPRAVSMSAMKTLPPPARIRLGPGKKPVWKSNQSEDGTGRDGVPTNHEKYLSGSDKG